MPDLPARWKNFQARKADVADFRLGNLLQMPVSALAEKVGDARVVVARPQEIDALGEGGDDLLARQSMGSVIGNVTRAVRKLAKVGIEASVLTADHGRELPMRKEEDIRMDNPGGDVVALHFPWDKLMVRVAKPYYLLT